MAITIDVPANLAKTAEDAAKSYGYESASDWARDWLKNSLAQYARSAAAPADDPGKVIEDTFDPPKADEADAPKKAKRGK